MRQLTLDAAAPRGGWNGWTARHRCHQHCSSRKAGESNCGHRVKFPATRKRRLVSGPATAIPAASPPRLAPAVGSLPSWSSPSLFFLPFLARCTWERTAVDRVSSSYMRRFCLECNFADFTRNVIFRFRFYPRHLRSPKGRLVYQRTPILEIIIKHTSGPHTIRPRVRPHISTPYLGRIHSRRRLASVQGRTALHRTDQCGTKPRIPSHGNGFPRAPTARFPLPLPPLESQIAISKPLSTTANRIFLLPSSP